MEEWGNHIMHIQMYIGCTKIKTKVDKLFMVVGTCTNFKIFLRPKHISILVGADFALIPQTQVNMLRDSDGPQKLFPLNGINRLYLEFYVFFGTYVLIVLYYLLCRTKICA